MKKKQNVSTIRSSFLKCVPIINLVICCVVSRRNQVFIGIYPIIRLYYNFRLSRGLIAKLHKKNIVVLKQVEVSHDQSDGKWITTHDLELNVFLEI